MWSLLLRTYCSLLGGHELVSVELDGGGVGQDGVVRDQVGVLAHTMRRREREKERRRDRET
jgi:hypothetical protein